MSCNAYLMALQDLYSEEQSRVIVSHKPMTERYHRANDYLDDLINHGETVGFRDVCDGVVELAIFCEPEPDSSACGEYGVFRMKVAVHRGNTFADTAILFAFYDNKSDAGDSGNKDIYDMNQAEQLMLNFNGYQVC